MTLTKWQSAYPSNKGKEVELNNFPGNNLYRWSVIIILHQVYQGFPGASDGNEFACSAGDPGLFPDLGRSSGEGNGYPLHYSYLKNPMNRGAWQATVHGVAKTQTQLSS